MNPCRRALWGAKRLRVRLGLPQDLLAHPWFVLERPENVEPEAWARAIAKLERHELVVWWDLARVVEVAAGRFLRGELKAPKYPPRAA
jgi:hypothetical protein